MRAGGEHLFPSFEPVQEPGLQSQHPGVSASTTRLVPPIGEAHWISLCPEGARRSMVGAVEPRKKREKMLFCVSVSAVRQEG